MSESFIVINRPNNNSSDESVHTPKKCLNATAYPIPCKWEMYNILLIIWSVNLDISEKFCEVLYIRKCLATWNTREKWYLRPPAIPEISPIDTNWNRWSQLESLIACYLGCQSPFFQESFQWTVVRWFWNVQILIFKLIDSRLSYNATMTRNPHVSNSFTHVFKIWILLAISNCLFCEENSILVCVLYNGARSNRPGPKLRRNEVAKRCSGIDWSFTFYRGSSMS